MPVVSVNDVSLYVEDVGTGPPVLLAHAFLGRADVWAGQRMALRARHRVITYDARGHGRSDAPHDPTAYSLAIAVADLTGVLDVLGIESAHLCGLSMGAKTVLHTMLRHPHRVRSAVLADPGAGSDDVVAFRKDNERLARDFETKGSAWTFENRLANSAFVSGLGDRRQRAIEGMQALVESQDPIAIAHIIRNVLSPRPSVYSLEHELRAIRCPVLVVSGERDAAVEEPARYLADTIPGAESVVIPDVGHVTNILAPGPFNEALLTFLDRHERNGGAP